MPNHPDGTGFEFEFESGSGPVAGVYCIRCTNSKGLLVAATACLASIKGTWKTRNHPHKMRRAIEKYGLDSFEFKVLLECETHAQAIAKCDLIVEGVRKKAKQKLYWPPPAAQAPEKTPCVYVLVAGDDAAECKIGVTSDAAKRLSTYQTSAPNRDFRFHKTWNVDSMQTARAIEGKVLEDAAAAFEVKNEWVCAAPSIICGMIEDTVAIFSGAQKIAS